MKRILMLAFVAGAVLGTTVLTESTEAQVNGYRFGVGIRQSHQFQRRAMFGFRATPREQPPYFAMHPPVYYSDQIIRRPYGVSPFAAPAGIMPVEMQLAPKPKRIVNPHVDSLVAPKDDAKPKKKKGKNKKGDEKTTSNGQGLIPAKKIVNQYYQTPFQRVVAGK